MGGEPGYAGSIARVDLSTGAVTDIPTEEYAEGYLGGRGMATRIYWDAVGPEVQAFDPENRLIFATGPCAGFDGLAGARWVVCGKSPGTTPHYFSHSNLGGSWGTELKFAGLDGLVVQGRAERPVYLLIENGKINVRDASAIWGKGAVQVREMLKGELGNSVKVVATGPAGDNMTALATLLADNDSCGSGSLGAVMGSKKLKAIAVRGSYSVNAAHPQRLQELLDYIKRLRKGTPRADAKDREGVRKDPCHRCADECPRVVYEGPDGSMGKVMCQSGSFYNKWASTYYGQPGDFGYLANRMCDDHGLNTKAIESMVTWLERCHQAGLLTEKDTNLPINKIGSMEFMEALTRCIALRQGFGEVLAQGLPRAAEALGNQALELIAGEVTRAGEAVAYSPQAFITTGLLYAVEPRQPIQQLHELMRLSLLWVPWAEGEPHANFSSNLFRAIAKRFWGSEDAADFSSYENKALAAKMIQDRELVKDSLILCDYAWPLFYVEHSADHMGDPSLESKIYSAITGRDSTEVGLYRIGERIFNLQRAVLSREGHLGRAFDRTPESSYNVSLKTERLNPDCLFPGKDGEVISRKGALLDRNRFQEMLSEFYGLRGWDQETGLQRKEKLEELGLGDVARDLRARDLLA
jgi:aldehyde:ferredoxin oxidoreductase